MPQEPFAIWNSFVHRLDPHMDEPFNGLDVDTGLKIGEIISGLDRSYIIISHEIDFLLYTTDKICTIIKGRIIFEDEAQIHPHG